MKVSIMSNKYIEYKNDIIQQVEMCLISIQNRDDEMIQEDIKILIEMLPEENQKNIVIGPKGYLDTITLASIFKEVKSVFRRIDYIGDTYIV